MPESFLSTMVADLAKDVDADERERLLELARALDDQSARPDRHDEQLAELAKAIRQLLPD